MCHLSSAFLRWSTRFCNALHKQMVDVFRSSYVWSCLSALPTPSRYSSILSNGGRSCFILYLAEADLSAFLYPVAACHNRYTYIAGKERLSFFQRHSSLRDQNHNYDIPASYHPRNDPSLDDCLSKEEGRSRLAPFL